MWGDAGTPSQGTGEDGQLGLVQEADSAGGRVTVRVSGAVDVLTAPRLAALLADLSEQQVLVDIAGVEVLCAAGLDVLAAAAGTSATVGGRLRVTGARPLAARCFAITELQALLEP